jgi:hypothetical protein
MIDKGFAQAEWQQKVWKRVEDVISRPPVEIDPAKSEATAESGALEPENPPPAAAEGDESDASATPSERTGKPSKGPITSYADYARRGEEAFLERLGPPLPPDPSKKEAPSKQPGETSPLVSDERLKFLLNLAAEGLDQANRLRLQRPMKVSKKSSPALSAEEWDKRAAYSEERGARDAAQDQENILSDREGQREITAGTPEANLGNAPAENRPDTQNWYLVRAGKQIGAGDDSRPLWAC